MLETYHVVLAQSRRNLIRNIKKSPFLYFLFSIITVFSGMFLAFISLIIIRNEIAIDLDNVFFIIFFLFIMKGSHDFYHYFTRSDSLTYILSTKQSQMKTVFEVFLVVFWVQLGLWVLISTIYSTALVIAGVNPSYPVVYVQFTLGVMLSSVLGSILTIHYFSTKKYRLIPLGMLFGVFYLFHDVVSLAVLLPLSFAYLLWSLRNCLDSYQYVSRKKRKKEKAQLWLSSITKAVFYKELVILWRDKLLFSVLSSSVFMGITTGYIARYGAGDLLPESLNVLVSRFSPEAYAFFGIYVLTIQGAVFISLSFFLNEEHTLWLLRHVPVKMNDFVIGKAFALGMPLFCSIPFVAYYASFMGTRSVLFLLWFLLFSYLLALIVCFPFAARYVGRKSDILLLYFLSMIVFLVLSITFSFQQILTVIGVSPIVLYLSLLLIEVVVFLLISLRLTTRQLMVRYLTRPGFVSK
jgi:hypothetical protein